MKKLISLGTAALWAALTPVCGSAAESESSDSTVINLRDIEIVANRANENTPVAFSGLDYKQIDAINDGRDIPFMLETLPSVVTTGDAGGGIGYSGIRVRGTDASRINVTANGIPINDSESHNVYWVNMPDLASSLRDIQLQRGAGTSTNGAGAFGASINMLTDAPSHERGAEFHVGYGSYNSNRQTIKVNSGLFGGHWSADARLSHIGSDGYIARAFSKLWSYMGQLAYQNYGTTLRLIAFGGKEQTYMAWDYASKEEMDEYGRRYNPCGEYTASDGSIAYYPDQTDNFVQHHFQLLFGQALGQDWHLNVALHYTKGDGYYNQLKTNRNLYEYGLEPISFVVTDTTYIPGINKGKPFLPGETATITKSDLVRMKHNDNDFGGGMFALKYEHGRVNAQLGGAMNWHRGWHFGNVAWVRNYIGDINPLQEYYRNIGRKFDSNIYARADVEITKGLSAYADLQFRHIHYTIEGRSDNYLDYDVRPDGVIDWSAGHPVQLNIHRDWNFFNPKAGLTYINGAHRAFASWSVAHKEPTRDNFTDADPGHYPVAERLFDYELGYRFSNKLLTVGANLYYMDYKNQLVVTGMLSDTGNPVSVNVPKSYRMGIELQGELRPLDWFDWQVNATLSRNRIKNFVEYIFNDEWYNPDVDGNGIYDPAQPNAADLNGDAIAIDCGETPIAFSPDFIFNNSFNFHVKGFDASLVTKYVSSQYMNNARSEIAKLDAYCVSDLRLAYTFKKIHGVKALRLGFTVYNIFNAKYFNNGYTGAGYYINDEGKPEIYRYAGFAAQAPTNVMATVSLSF